MKNFVCLLIALGAWLMADAQEIMVGMTDTAAYFPALKGRRVALLANRTSVAKLPNAEEEIHLVDLLHQRGFNLTAIFSPEHGFRGDADAGEAVANSTDPQTGIPIRSLYNGRTHRPSDEAMRSFDVLVVDMQDVGLRFYTYYISMLRMMDACADFGHKVIVLDRPNPNGHHIDGPILDMKYKSGVGALPIPVLHGLTMGEIARMAIGEGWAKACDLEVVACRNYTHQKEYILPIAPSPNLPTQQSIYLYASLCPFEATPISVGRGTDKPFEQFGHPDLFVRAMRVDLFTPMPKRGAKNPPLVNELCRGRNLRTMPLEDARKMGFSLRYIIEAYRDLCIGDKFFTPMFEKLVGVNYVRTMIEEGASEEEIRSRWTQEVEDYKLKRQQYLLYE